MNKREKVHQWWPTNKGHIFHFLYLLVGVVTIAIPYMAHQRGEVCLGGGIRHAAVFHLDFYRLKYIELLESKPLDLRWRGPASSLLEERYQGQRRTITTEPLSHGELWELFALIQAFLVSLLLMFEADDAIKPKFILLLAGLILALCYFAFDALRAENLKIYEMLLIAIVVGFSLVDALFFIRLRQIQSPDKEVFKFLLTYVDFPIVLAVVLLCSYVGFPIDEELAPFFSGAVAFQLMFGNIAIFIIRSHRHIERSEGFWDITKGIVTGSSSLSEEQK